MYDNQPLADLCELTHHINSPLAVIRNAIYLVSKRVTDPQALQYLAVAEQEVAAISDRLRATRNELMAEAGMRKTIPFPVKSVGSAA